MNFPSFAPSLSLQLRIQLNYAESMIHQILFLMLCISRPFMNLKILYEPKIYQHGAMEEA